MPNSTFCWDRHLANLAIWPSPVDHDVCMREAGIIDFADTDEERHREFGGLIRRTIRWAEEAGPLIATRFVGIRGVAHPPAEDVLLAAALDDGSAESVVMFGTMKVVTADGHPIVWLLGFEGSDVVAASVVARIAGPVPSQRLRVDLAKLAPTGCTIGFRQLWQVPRSCLASTRGAARGGG